MTIKEIASELGCTVQNISQLVRRGTIRAAKENRIYSITENDFNEYKVYRSYRLKAIIRGERKNG